MRKGDGNQMCVPGNVPAVVAKLTDDFAKRSIADRSRIIREVAALFVDNSGGLSAVQVGLFDDVLVRLVTEIDRELRIYLAEHLAPIDNAPRKAMADLAQDEDIAVAGPVLRHSAALDRDLLLDCARSRGQEHLKALSQRKQVGPQLADILAVRGDSLVLLTLAGNAGAALTDQSYTLIIERARDDTELASALWNRPDISRQQVVLLFERASAAVRHAMEDESGRLGPEIAAAIDLARRKLEDKTLDSSAAYAKARASIARLENGGGVRETHIRSIAERGTFEELVVALSSISRISAGEIERMLVEDNSIRLLIVLKAIAMSWFTVKQILLAARTTPMTAGRIEQVSTSYRWLSAEAAAKTLKYHRLREKARGEAAYGSAAPSAPIA